MPLTSANPTSRVCASWRERLRSCSRPQAVIRSLRRRRAGTGSAPPMCSAPAGWAAIPGIRSSMPPAAAIAGAICGSRTPACFRPQGVARHRPSRSTRSRCARQNELARADAFLQQVNFSLKFNLLGRNYQPKLQQLSRGGGGRSLSQTDCRTRFRLGNGAVRVDSSINRWGFS